MTSKYVFPEDMPEVVGNGHEEVFRRMVIAGLEWFDANPNADPRFESDVFGCRNEDARTLEGVVLKAYGHTAEAPKLILPAMLALRHILWVQANGWEAYVTSMRRVKAHDDGDVQWKESIIEDDIIGVAVTGSRHFDMASIVAIRWRLGRIQSRIGDEEAAGEIAVARLALKKTLVRLGHLDREKK